MPTVVWVILAFLAISIILAVLKKALKLIIIVAVIGCLLSVGAGWYDSIKSKYNVKVTDSVIEYNFNGTTGTVELDKVKETKITETDDGNTDVTFMLKDGSEYKVTIPKKNITSFVKRGLEKAKIEVSE